MCVLTPTHWHCVGAPELSLYLHRQIEGVFTSHFTNKKKKAHAALFIFESKFPVKASHNSRTHTLTYSLTQSPFTAPHELAGRSAAPASHVKEADGNEITAIPSLWSRQR